VNIESVQAKLLQAALDGGLISPADQFDGDSVLTRLGLAALLSKTSTVKLQLQDLLDWTKGF
jgi:hypothetical protein